MIKSVLEYVIKSLVDKPESVVVSEATHENKYSISIKVAEEDMGRIIGKDGQTIRVIRSLAQILNTSGEPITVDIIK